LQGVQVLAAQESVAKARPASFWWLSSLTGAAVAATVIVAINLQAPEPLPGRTEPAPSPLTVPSIEWNARSAVLTRPLQQEIKDLQSDLEKAEEAVKQDIERLF